MRHPGDSATALPGPAAARRARIAVGLVFFVNGAAFASWVSRIPALRASLHLGDGTLGSVLFAMSVGVLLSFPLAGKGAQVLGPRHLAPVAGALTLLMVPMPFLVGIVPSLVLVMLELGAASGTMQVAMNVLAVEVETCVGRPVMSSFHGLWSAGGLAGAGLGGLAAHAGLAPPVHLAIASGLLGAVLGVAVFLLRGVDLARPRRGVPVPAAGESVPPRRWAGLDRVLLGLGIVCFCSFLAEGALADWSAVFLRERTQASESLAALGYAVFAGAMTSMRLVGDRVLACFGAARTLRLFNALGALALAGALASQATGVAMAAFALMGLGLATVVPSAFGAAARHAESTASHDGDAERPGHHPAHSARAIALMSGFGYTGLLAGPPLIGWLAQATNLRWALGLLVVLVAAIAVLVPLIGARCRVPPAGTARCASARAAAGRSRAG